MGNQAPPLERLSGGPRRSGRIERRPAKTSIFIAKHPFLPEVDIRQVRFYCSSISLQSEAQRPAG